jgi:hypothetical protein
MTPVRKNVKEAEAMRSRRPRNFDEELDALEAHFLGRIIRSMRDEARFRASRNRRLARDARPLAGAYVDEIAPGLAPVERAREIRKAARTMVSAGDGDALELIRRARMRPGDYVIDWSAAWPD